MKRLIYTSTSQKNSKLMKLEIKVSYDSEYVRTGSILNIHDNEFFDFESAILSDFELRDFVLEGSYESNRADSVSQYYIYSKTNEEGTNLNVLIELRIFDRDTHDIIVNGTKYQIYELVLKDIEQHLRDLDPEWIQLEIAQDINNEKIPS